MRKLSMLGWEVILCEIGLGRFRVAEQDRRVPSPQATVYAEVEVCALLSVFA